MEFDLSTFLLLIFCKMNYPELVEGGVVQRSFSHFPELLFCPFHDDVTDRLGSGGPQTRSLPCPVRLAPVEGDQVRQSRAKSLCLDQGIGKGEIML